MLKLLSCINKVNHSFIATFVYPLPHPPRRLKKNATHCFQIPVSIVSGIRQSPQEDNAFKQNLEGGGGGGINKVYYRQFQEMGVRIAEKFFFFESLTFLTPKLFKHCIIVLIH